MLLALWQAAVMAVGAVMTQSIQAHRSWPVLIDTALYLGLQCLARAASQPHSTALAALSGVACLSGIMSDPTQECWLPSCLSHVPLSSLPQHLPLGPISQR